MQIKTNTKQPPIPTALRFLYNHLLKACLLFFLRSFFALLIIVSYNQSKLENSNSQLILVRKFYSIFIIRRIFYIFYMWNLNKY